MIKKGRHFLTQALVTPLVTAPGDNNPSDATVHSNFGQNTSLWAYDMKPSRSWDVLPLTIRSSFLSVRGRIGVSTFWNVSGTVEPWRLRGVKYGEGVPIPNGNRSGEWLLLPRTLLILDTEMLHFVHLIRPYALLFMTSKGLIVTHGGTEKQQNTCSCEKNMSHI